MSEITVSVIVPLYNEERYIRAFLDSLLTQTYPKEDMEWLLVDGDSSDRTVEIIKEYEGRGPLRLLRNPKRKTPYALNLAIEQARGEYIVRLDAHAAFPPDYIEKCVHYLNVTDADNVGGVAETKSKGFIGNAISHMLSTRFGVGGSDFRVGDGDKYVDTVPFGAFRKSVFERVGLFNPALLRSEDNEMNARIRAAGGKIWLANDIRFQYYCRDTVKGILKMALQNGNALFRTLRVNRRAMGLRHFIPFFFLLSLLILPPLAAFFPLLGWALAAEGSLYLLLDIYFSFFHKRPRLGLVALWLYPLFHVSYGLGSLLGLFGIELY